VKKTGRTRKLGAKRSGDTARFYDDLMVGDEKRSILGMSHRFNSDRVAGKPSVKRHFTDLVGPQLSAEDRVLDFGCGPGAFLSATSPFCASIVGADISRGFIDASRDLIKRRDIDNASVVHVGGNGLPFASESFDTVLCIDVLHHLEVTSAALEEIRRVLKPGGVLYILEPNQMNPAIWLMHLFDRNEWGLLRLGTPGRYRRLLESQFDVVEWAYNGIVIGPGQRGLERLGDLLSQSRLRRVLGWLSPKIMIKARRPL
jgi:SAM-dependent methyltransferase